MDRGSKDDSPPHLSAFSAAPISESVDLCYPLRARQTRSDQRATGNVAEEKKRNVPGVGRPEWGRQTVLADPAEGPGLRLTKGAQAIVPAFLRSDLYASMAP